MILPSRYNIALARAAYCVIMAGRALFCLGHDAIVTRGNVRWALDLREGLDLTIYVTGYFQRFVVGAYRRLLKPGQVALDLGANMGGHTLHLAVAAGVKGRVVAVEPTAYPFQRLTRNIQLNPDLAQRIHAHQALLVAEPGQPIPATINSSWPVAGDIREAHPLHMGVPQATTSAISMTLDQLVEREGLDRVDLIKLDVDGAEWDVLRGGWSMLQRFRPILVIEIAPFALKEQGVDALTVVSALADLGYRFETLSGKSLPANHSVWLNRIPHGFSKDVVAHPMDRLS